MKIVSTFGKGKCMNERIVENELSNPKIVNFQSK